MTGGHEKSAASVERRESSFDVLRKFDWTARGNFTLDLSNSEEKVAELNVLPGAGWTELPDGTREPTSSPAAVVTAYYALETYRGLKPFPELLNHQLSSAEFDDDRFRLGAAIVKELMAASKVYSTLAIQREQHARDLSRLKHNVKSLTSAYNASNLGALAALENLSRNRANKPSLAKNLAAEAGYLIRMLVAKELANKSPGAPTDYSRMAKPVF